MRTDIKGSGKAWLLLLVLSLSGCAPSLMSWGDAPVRKLFQFHNCTVYGLVSDPEHQYWVVCEHQP